MTVRETLSKEAPSKEAPSKETPSKEAPKGKARKPEASYLGIAKLFRLSEPERVKGRDGQTYIIVDRYGAEGGAFTREKLFEKEGFEDEIASYERQCNRIYSKSSLVRENVESRRHKLMRVLESRIRRYKAVKTKEYAAQGLIPLMGFMRIVSNDDPKFFIAGFVNERHEPVIGDVNDHALWSIMMLRSTKGLDRARRMALSLSKKISNLRLEHGVRRDLSAVLADA